MSNNPALVALHNVTAQTTRKKERQKERAAG